MSTLALAWTIHNPNVSTCILGATKPEQLEENVKVSQSSVRKYGMFNY